MELKVWRIFVACDVSGMKMAVSSAYVRSVKRYWQTSWYIIGASYTPTDAQLV